MFFLYLIAGLTGHGLWTFFSVVLGAAGTGLSQNPSSAALGAGSLLAVLEVAILVTFIFAAALWIVLLVGWAKRQEVKP